MARYIDIESLDVAPYKYDNEDFVEGVIFVLEKLDAIPTADVVEVRRCRECEYYVASYCTRDIKGRTNMFYMQPYDFCSYGERKNKE